MLKPEECVLVIVDVQGKLAQIMQGSEQLHQQLQTLIQGAQLFEIPILWLEQLPDKLGATSQNYKHCLKKPTCLSPKHILAVGAVMNLSKR